MSLDLLNKLAAQHRSQKRRTCWTLSGLLSTTLTRTSLHLQHRRSQVFYAQQQLSYRIIQGGVYRAVKENTDVVRALCRQGGRLAVIYIVTSVQGISQAATSRTGSGAVGASKSVRQKQSFGIGVQGVKALGTLSRLVQGSGVTTVQATAITS